MMKTIALMILLLPVTSWSSQNTPVVLGKVNSHDVMNITIDNLVGHYKSFIIKKSFRKYIITGEDSYTLPHGIDGEKETETKQELTIKRDLVSWFRKNKNNTIKCHYSEEERRRLYPVGFNANSMIVTAGPDKEGFDFIGSQALWDKVVSNYKYAQKKLKH